MNKKFETKKIYIRMFSSGVIIAILGGCVLLGIKLYEAFEIGLKHGIVVSATTMFIIGFGLAVLSLIFSCMETSFEDNKNSYEKG